MPEQEHDLVRPITTRLRQIDDAGERGRTLVDVENWRVCPDRRAESAGRIADHGPHEGAAQPGSERSVEIMKVPGQSFDPEIQDGAFEIESRLAFCDAVPRASLQGS